MSAIQRSGSSPKTLFPLSCGMFLVKSVPVSPMSARIMLMRCWECVGDFIRSMHWAQTSCIVW